MTLKGSLLFNRKKKKLTEEITIVEDVDVIEPNGNVVSFSSKKPNEEGPDPKFDFREFLTKIESQKDDIEDFVFIGIRKDGQTAVSAKAESNLHLYWIIKRFMRHLEGVLFD